MFIKNKHKSPDSSQLFTVRVWVEAVNQDTRQLRIQVKHVLSGATRTFLQWPQAIAFIEAQLAEGGPNQAQMER